jgi:hypothetical protein
MRLIFFARASRPCRSTSFSSLVNASANRRTPSASSPSPTCVIEMPRSVTVAIVSRAPSMFSLRLARGRP